MKNEDNKCVSCGFEKYNFSNINVMMSVQIIFTQKIIVLKVIVVLPLFVPWWKLY